MKKTKTAPITASMAIGSIKIYFNGERLWLYQSVGGEGMEVDEAKLEKLLQDYYNENF